MALIFQGKICRKSRVRKSDLRDWILRHVVPGIQAAAIVVQVSGYLRPIRDREMIEREGSLGFDGLDREIAAYVADTGQL